MKIVTKMIKDGLKSVRYVVHGSPKTTEIMEEIDRMDQAIADGKVAPLDFGDYRWKDLEDWRWDDGK